MSPSALSRRRIAPALIGILVFAILAALYLAGPLPLYYRIIAAWGVDPFPYPFVDTDTVLSAVRCLRKGIDVYVANPCDPLRRVYDYSPLWMVLAVFPMTLAWLPPIGLIVDAGFLAALFLLPAGRTRGGVALIVLAVLSTATVFAVERGNNDLVLFALAAGAATLACRTPRLRLAGYALALLAGLLKYYPMTLMLIAMRERIGRLLAVAAAAIALTLLFAAATWHDLVRALQLIPTGYYFGPMFGAITVGGGLADRHVVPAGAVAAIRWTMTAVALAIGIAWGLRARFAAHVATLSEREGTFLLVGALLILSCFFTAQNIGYRAVHLILVMPALAALGRDARLFRAGAIVALLLLWSEGWRVALMAEADALGGHWHARMRWATWALREGCWWWLVTLLTACTTALLVRSEAAREAAGWLRRARPA